MSNLTARDYVVKVEGELIFAFTPYILKDVCKRIPGARWNADARAWTYPATEASALVVHRRFPASLTRDSSFLRLLDSANQTRAESETIRHAVSLDPIPVSKLAGWQHQLQAFWFAREKPGAMLAMEMGTGKTKVTIDVLQNNGARNVLIIAPKKVVRNVWPGEFEKHCAVPYNITVLDHASTAAKVVAIDKAIQTTGGGTMNVFIINYESVWRAEMAKRVMRVEWDYIVCDESHKIKSPQGKASKFIGQLAEKARRRLALTGTPLSQGPLDAFGQYRFLDPSIFGSSFTRFKHSYAEFGGFQNYQIVGYKNEDDFNSRFYSIAYRAGKDVLDLPPFHHVPRMVQLPASARRFYDEFESEFVAMAGDGVLSASNALVKLLRLQQITGGEITTETADGEAQRVEIHSEKADALAEILDEIDPAQPVVVFAKFTADLRAVRKVAEEAGRGYFELSGRVDELDAFKRADGGEVIGVQISSGGAGVDLTRAHYCVYYSVGFSLLDYEQSLSRTHRPGQDSPVTYLHLIAENTVDEKVYSALQDKREIVDFILSDLSGVYEE